MGMPMEVVVKRPMTDRKRIPMAKVRLRLENGTRMTIIDWEITHGLALLPLEVVLLGLFIRATTCDGLDVNLKRNFTAKTFHLGQNHGSSSNCAKKYKRQPSTIPFFVSNVKTDGNKNDV